MKDDFAFILGYFDRKLNARCKHTDSYATYISMCTEDHPDFESAFIELRESALFKLPPRGYKND
jgi:hypothetical protein